MRNDNFSSIIAIKAESQTNKTIPSTLLCPLSQLIFLEPVKLLFHDQSDFEKDFPDKITTCPISRIKITQRIRGREIEHLVAESLCYRTGNRFNHNVYFHSFDSICM